MRVDTDLLDAELTSDQYALVVEVIASEITATFWPWCWPDCTQPSYASIRGAR